MKFFEVLKLFKSYQAQVESLMEEKSLLASEVEDCRALLNLCQSEIERSLHRKSLSLLGNCTNSLLQGYPHKQSIAEPKSN